MIQVEINVKNKSKLVYNWTSFPPPLEASLHWQRAVPLLRESVRFGLGAVEGRVAAVLAPADATCGVEVLVDEVSAFLEMIDAFDTVAPPQLLSQDLRLLDVDPLLSHYVLPHLKHRHRVLVRVRRIEVIRRRFLELNRPLFPAHFLRYQMVGAYCASSSSSSSSLLPPPLTTTATTKSLKPPHSSSNCTPPLPPRKLTRRKNHLRPKILKTPPKPLILPPPPPQTSPIIPVILPPENDTVFDSPTLKTGGIVPGVEELERTQLSATEGVAATQHGAVSGNSITGNSLLRIGLGLVGVFVLQTICSVWILGKASEDEKDENLKVVEKNVSGLNDGKFLVSDLDRKRLEYRINEIRAMAREARKIEAENGGGEGDIVGEDAGFDGIGKEISARLVKVERKMGLRNGKLPELNLNDLDEFEEGDEAEEDDEEVDEDESLVFKKKFKFRSPSSIGLRSDVKGFGLDGHNVYEKKKSGIGGLSDGSMEEKKGNDGALIGNVNGSLRGVEGLEKVQRENEVGSSSMRFGTVQGTSQERSVEVTKSGHSTDLGKQILQKSKEEGQKSALKSNRDAVMGRNNVSKHSVLGKKPDVKSDLWWMKLPYVLAILMRRGPEHEEAGFFTLRSTSQTPYTVAFENHGDANNFCYLLDSYFEDLGDFHADIISLPVKELHDAVKSNTKKVIVVKKGQLKLYAGQPFADVEMALHSLIE